MSLFFPGCTPRLTRALSFGLLLAAIVFGTGPVTSTAAPLSYTVTMSEDENVCANPMDMMAQMMAAWQTEHVLMVKRGQPYVQVNVDPNIPSTAQMSTYTLTIGKPTLYSFDWANMVETSPGVTWTLLTPSTTPMATTSELVSFNFTGLTAGKFVRFQTGLISDPGNSTLFPDYRTVFFDMNGNGDTSDNSLSRAVFTDGNTQTVVQGRLEDFENLMPTIMDPQPFVHHGSDHVVPFDQTFGTIVVPEPSSVVLGALGGLGLLAYGARRKRGQRASPTHAA